MQCIVRIDPKKPRDKTVLRRYLDNDWKIVSSHTVGQGYDASKTCCLGACFLPLALLGRNPDLVEYIVEKDEKKLNDKDKTLQEHADSSDTGETKIIVLLFIFFISLFAVGFLKSLIITAVVGAIWLLVENNKNHSKTP